MTTVSLVVIEATPSGNCSLETAVTAKNLFLGNLNGSPCFLRSSSFFFLSSSFFFLSSSLFFLSSALFLFSSSFFFSSSFLFSSSSICFCYSNCFFFCSSIGFINLGKDGISFSLVLVNSVHETRTHIVE